MTSVVALGVAVRVGRVDGKFILNPTFQQLEFSDVDVVVSGTKDSIMMVEGGAGEISEADMVEALKVAQKGLQELVVVQEELLAKNRVPKMEWTKPEPPAALAARVKAIAERWCGGRLVSVLEGGYDLAALAESAEAHVRALME